MHDFHSYLPEVIRLAELAGEKILEIYKTDFNVETKEDNSPLTQADLRAHHAIVDGLTKLTPDIPVLSEESSITAFEERSKWNQYWLIDPLDGTREFVKKNGEFTVNIALIKNHQPVIGVVYVPVTHIHYYASLDSGAYKKVPNEEVVNIQVRAKPDQKIMVAGSRSHRGSSLENFLKHFEEYEIISMGSSLKLCLVAEGIADIYPRLGPTSEWDIAAAQCIVEAAGGYVTDTQMKPMKYNTKDSLLNPHFFVFGDKTIQWSSFLD
ncbi:MAG: 3'(2'),5'-bisphosphate nucleotidase CysQ [Methylococcales bacterium]|jgi:3'(2'), 5'-bisphosphate nucleotidase|nr:3'(2'),5'-bisphosphate nucleotidase CysQ [Methylococcales bacterium]